MPASSKHQKAAAGAALAAKRGQLPRKKLSGAAGLMADSMTEEQLADFARGSGASLPNKKSPKRKAKK